MPKREEPQQSLVEHTSSVEEFKQAKQFLAEIPTSRGSNFYDELLETLESNNRRGFLFTGEPGMGKTTMISALRGALSHVNVFQDNHRNYCSDSDGFYPGTESNIEYKGGLAISRQKSLVAHEVALSHISYDTFFAQMVQMNQNIDSVSRDPRDPDDSQREEIGLNFLQQIKSKTKDALQFLNDRYPRYPFWVAEAPTFTTDGKNRGASTLRLLGQQPELAGKFLIVGIISDPKVQKNAETVRQAAHDFLEKNPSAIGLRDYLNSLELVQIPEYVVDKALGVAMFSMANQSEMNRIIGRRRQVLDRWVSGQIRLAVPGLVHETSIFYDEDTYDDETLDYVHSITSHFDTPEVKNAFLWNIRCLQEQGHTISTPSRRGTAVLVFNGHQDIPVPYNPVK